MGFRAGDQVAARVFLSFVVVHQPISQLRYQQVLNPQESGRAYQCYGGSRRLDASWKADNAYEQAATDRPCGVAERQAFEDALSYRSRQALQAGYARCGQKARIYDHKRCCKPVKEKS